MASRVSLLVAVTLVIVKIGAWLATGSVALLASAADALVDTVASLVTFYWVRFADRRPISITASGTARARRSPPSPRRRLLIAAAAILAFQSVERLIFPEPITAVDLGLWVTVGSLLAAIRSGRHGDLGDARAHRIDRHRRQSRQLPHRYRRQRGGAGGARRLQHGPVGCAPIRLSPWRSRATCCSTPRRIAAGALAQLLDRELSQDDRDRIKVAVLACEGVCVLHDLRTRYAGDRTFVELHLEIDGGLTVDRAHANPPERRRRQFAPRCRALSKRRPAPSRSASKATDLTPGSGGRSPERGRNKARSAA